MATVTVDFTKTVQALPKAPVSTTVSTYGRSITSDSTLADVYGKLIKGQLVRIPLQWNGGNVVSSAGGGPRNVSGDDWINTIIRLGALPQIVIGGSADNNFSPSDAANLVSRYKGKLQGVVLGNEPGNGGMSIQDYVNKVYLPAAKAIRQADPSLKIIGPAWAWFDGNSIQYFINNAKGYYDEVDYHHYGCGNPPAPSDTDLMNMTSDFTNEVKQIRTWLNNAGQQNVGIQVGEFNLAWQYNDGMAGGEKRFYTAYNVAWSASATGHILAGGARAVAYSNQNGPLGIVVEPGNNDMGMPNGTPMPIYHGLGMFQGEGLFSGVGGSLVQASSDTGSLECFASSNGNVVLINKSANPVSVNYRLTGAGSGSKPIWATDPSQPTKAPRQLGNADGSALNLQGYQVATILAGTGSSTTTPPTGTPTTTTPPPSGSQPVAIAAAGASAPSGWATVNAVVSGGTQAANAGVVTGQGGDVPAALFDSERYGDQSWTLNKIPTKGAQLEVFFAEKYEGVTKAGDRVMSLSVNGVLVAPKLDVFAQAGGRNKVLRLVYPLADVDTAVVRLKGVTGSAFVNGLRVTAL